MATKSVKPKLYHGHVTIELTNAQTGVRDRIEHDNEFTDALEKCLMASGYFVNSPYEDSSYRRYPAYQRFVGGIFLFDKVINKVNGKYPTMMPAGTKMVGNGSYEVSNSSEVTELGSYNQEESSFSDEELKFVYDWGTQMEGDIACVSLTSDVGGYIGYGNSKSQVAHQTKKSLYENQSFLTSSTSQREEYCNSLVQTIGYNMLYQAVNVENGYLTYTSRPISVSAVSLFDAAVTHSVALPSNISGSAYVIMNGGCGKFAIIQNRIANGNVVTFGIYNCVTEEWVTYTFTASLATTLTMTNASANIAFCDDYFVLPKASGGTTNVQVIPYGMTAIREKLNSSNARVVHNIAPGLVMDNTGIILDLTTGETAPTNASMSSDYLRMCVDQNNKFVGSAYANGSYRTIMFNSPLYLATVANLDEVVHKTDEYTMKLTYKITREE